MNTCVEEFLDAETVAKRGFQVHVLAVLLVGAAPPLVIHSCDGVNTQ